MTPKNPLRGIGFGALLISFTGAFADDVKISGPVGVAGTGCPVGTSQVIPLEDGSGATIIFSAWDLQVAREDQFNGVFKKDKNCTVSIPLHIPTGIQVNTIYFTYNGFADLPAQSWAYMFNQYSFNYSGRVGRPQVLPKFQFLGGPTSDAFSRQDDPRVLSNIVSPCGIDALMNVNSRMQLENRNQEESAKISLDSIDVNIKKEFEFKVYWRSSRCRR